MGLKNCIFANTVTITWCEHCIHHRSTQKSNQRVTTVATEFSSKFRLVCINKHRLLSSMQRFVQTKSNSAFLSCQLPATLSVFREVDISAHIKKCTSPVQLIRVIGLCYTSAKQTHNKVKTFPPHHAKSSNNYRWGGYLRRTFAKRWDEIRIRKFGWVDFRFSSIMFYSYN